MELANPTNESIIFCCHAQVFYDAKDAVAFCLQAQQMLSMQQWPIHKEINSEEQSTPLMSSYVNPVSDLPLKKSRSISSLSILQPLSSSHPLTSTTKHHGVDQDKNVNIDVQVRMGLASGFLCPGESLHAHPTIEFAKGGCCREHSACCFSHTRFQLCMPEFSVQARIFEAGMNFVVGGVREVGGGKMDREGEAPWHGCVLLCSRSRAYAEVLVVLMLALRVHAEVSDAAVGGQILMEGSTFDAIKDVLGELGTVDAQLLSKTCWIVTLLACFYSLLLPLGIGCMS
eukprot:1159381-Pelagomonas_calceolata.AAC.13